MARQVLPNPLRPELSWAYVRSVIVPLLCLAVSITFLCTQLAWFDAFMGSVGVATVYVLIHVVLNMPRAHAPALRQEQPAAMCAPTDSDDHASQPLAGTVTRTNNRRISSKCTI